MGFVGTSLTFFLFQSESLIWDLRFEEMKEIAKEMRRFSILGSAEVRHGATTQRWFFLDQQSIDEDSSNFLRGITWFIDELLMISFGSSAIFMNVPALPSDQVDSWKSVNIINGHDNFSCSSFRILWFYFR